MAIPNINRAIPNARFGNSFQYFPLPSAEILPRENPWERRQPRPPLPTEFPIRKQAFPSLPETPALQTLQTTQPKIKATPFLNTLYSSMKNMDQEQRPEYLASTAENIKSRLERFEFRLARGIPLTAEQQSQYNNLRNAYNDIQSYMNNQGAYDAYYQNYVGKGWI